MIAHEDFQDNNKCKKCYKINCCSKPCSYLKYGSSKEQERELHKMCLNKMIEVSPATGALVGTLLERDKY